MEDGIEIPCRGIWDVLTNVQVRKHLLTASYKWAWSEYERVKYGWPSTNLANTGKTIDLTSYQIMNGHALTT